MLRSLDLNARCVVVAGDDHEDGTSENTLEDDTTDDDNQLPFDGDEGALYPSIY